MALHSDFVAARWWARGLLVAVLLALPAAASAQSETLRVGHFPNVTHVQALIAHNLSRQGKGWFEQRLPGVKLEWFIYNAGPSAIEAIFANAIDLTYVGPNPAINAYIRSRGEEVRIIAGAVNGGAALVVQPDLAAQTAADFKGRKIATPQFGNTQDVSARAWLAAGGLRITQTGGDAQVIPTSNPDQLSLFKSRQLDAVWTVEPWVSRLELEAQAKVLVEEKDAVTTVLVSSVGALSKRRDLVTRFATAHKELTDWIIANPQEAQRIAREEIETSTRATLPAELIARSWPRLVITSTVTQASMEGFLKRAQSVGFLRGTADLAKLVEAP